MRYTNPRTLLLLFTLQTCSHKLRVNYSASLADNKYWYCVGACFNVTGDDLTAKNVSYSVMSPAVSAKHFAVKGTSQTGTSLHVTEVRTTIKDKDTYHTLLPRHAMHKRGLSCRALFVRLSVRPSRSCILSKRINIQRGHTDPKGKTIGREP